MPEKAGRKKFWAYDVIHTENAGLTLLDNVQFIYELVLAELELEALGAEYEVLQGLRGFQLGHSTPEQEQKIIERSSYFRSIGERYTDYYHIIQKNRTRSVNQYLTHWIYPYKGKFHPQMIRALLNIIGLNRGDTVFEPFSGSGTTALEAQLLGIHCLGIDVSPLCILQGNVKTQALYAIDEIIRFRDSLMEHPHLPDVIRDSKYSELFGRIEDPHARDFFVLARLLALSDEARRGRAFGRSFIKNVHTMIDSVKDYRELTGTLGLSLGKVELKTGDARKTGLPDRFVDGIITSPPYSIALDYVENDAHSLADMGYSLKTLKERFMGVRGKGKDKIGLYNEDMKKSYSEMHRILKPGKYAVIVIGNATYQGQEVKTVEFTVNEMTGLGFRLEKNIMKTIFGLYNVMKRENILIFKKGM